MSDSNINIVSNVALPPNTTITLTVNEPEPHIPQDKYISDLKTMNNTLQTYDAYQLSSSYGVSLLKQQINLLVDIISRQHDKINYLENILNKQ